MNDNDDRCRIITQRMIGDLQKVDNGMVLHVTGERMSDHMHFEMVSPSKPEIFYGAMMSILKTFIGNREVRRHFADPLQTIVGGWNQMVAWSGLGEDEDERKRLLLYSADDLECILEDATRQLKEENERLQTTVETFRFALEKLSKKPTTETEGGREDA